MVGLLDNPGNPLTAQLADFAAPFKAIFGGQPDLLGPDFTSFRILELPAEGVPNEILLVGEWMPHQPFIWGGQQHLAKEYYPGNSEPTVQVLGGRESELKLTGRFKVKRIKTEDEGTVRKIPSILCDALDAMRQRGNLIKLTLGEWQRWGFLEATEWKMKTLADVDYEMTFFIIGDKEPSQCKLADAGISLPIDTNLALISAAASLEALATQPFFGINQGLFALVTGLISDVATALKLVTTFVDTAISAAEDVEKLANRAIGLTKYAMSTIASFKARVGALDAYFGSNPKALGLVTWDEAKNALTAKYVLTAQMATSSPPTLSAAQVAAAQTKTAAYTPKLASQQQASANAGGGQSIDQLLQVMLAAFIKLSQTLPKARYMVRSGDTLEVLSVRYYGTIDNWKKIYDHNQLTTTVLVPGVVLEIPKL